MGAAFGSRLTARGITVLWCPDGRSEASGERARHAGLKAAALPSLLDHADVLLSLCPPAAATEVAALVASHGFAERTYVEANAISPERVGLIAALLPGAETIDASVVGSPPVGGKTATLYLAGEQTRTEAVERLFAGTDIHTHSLGTEVGAASALKLAYSSYQKASRVLAALSYGAAQAHGVGDELLAIAAKRTGSYLTETGYIPKTAARAWRWGPELADAAALLSDAGLPDELMLAAAATLERWDAARDTRLSVEEALKLLRRDPEEG
ncbi:NAD(P)-dependent oxidoreductase [Streptomyces sp. TN58]|uniref:NAD(P)-dependent oxidoreductase n=1 Tax=Streptomyces sp. TN58 TaxID=234612 RepID=UPI000950ADE4|nr:NAD(P)-dependent oxidoreductase [Streptomyces sp. TN58]APU44351.1 phosphogluconate dehydrogenase [Streptomyces sp. TN58]